MKALILSGGENKRLSIIKGFLELKGRRIIESNIELLKGIFDSVIISTNNPECYFYLDVPMVGDVLNYRGPMTGILSALVNSGDPELFVTACDMPFIKPELIRYIVGRWTDRREAVIPIFDGKPQPLVGIYSRKLVSKMEESIRTCRRGLRDFLNTIEVHYIEEEEVRGIDQEGKSFVNINTIQDYERERIAVGG